MVRLRTFKHVSSGSEVTYAVLTNEPFALVPTRPDQKIDQTLAIDLYCSTL
jgi:hypothetical protein